MTNHEPSNASRRHALKTLGLGLGAVLSPMTSCSTDTTNGPKSPLGLIEPLYFSSATAIARAIKNKEISSQEITQIFLDRIAQVNSRLNAVVLLKGEEAIAGAKKADKALAKGEVLGSLHGVPITMKDSFDTKGMISTAGTMGRANFIPDNDATIVRRLKKAGAIIMGKTNTPELTLSGSTDNLVYGQTNNPYNLDLTPGGSSGGAAAIISSGGSPFDIGTDTGGSIRNPAHSCGLCGIKPTHGRVPRTGHIISYHAYDQALTTVGPLARYVEDLETILPIIMGSDGVDPYIFDLPLVRDSEADASKFKYVYYTDNGISTPTAEVQAVIQKAASSLSGTGAPVEEKQPPEIEKTLDVYFGIADGVDKNYCDRKLLAEAGTKEISPLLSWVNEHGDPTEKSLSPMEVAELFEGWSGFNSTMTSYFHEYDIILCPVSTMTAHPHGYEKVLDVFSYTMTYNLTGWPVAVVRVGTSSEGMPIGIQIVGKPWREDTVLAVAKFLEKEFGGFKAPTI